LVCKRLREVLTASEAEKANMMAKYHSGAAVDARLHWLR